MSRDRLSVPARIIFLRDKDGRFPCKPGIDIRRFLTNFIEIAECIRSGKPVPERYYRKSVGRDYLLEEKNWLHLHVGYGIDNSVLLIVEQTRDGVVFIALTDHDIFEERPRGKSLLGLMTKLFRAKLELKTQTVLKESD